MSGYRMNIRLNYQLVQKGQILDLLSKTRFGMNRIDAQFDRDEL